MKNIQIDNRNIFLIGFSSLTLVMGIVGFLFTQPIKGGPLFLLSCGISSAFTTILSVIRNYKRNHVIKLGITPTQITIIYNKKKSETVNIRDIASVDINVRKQTREKVFPYQISVSFKENSGFQNHFSIQKGNYNIVFRIYDSLLDIVPCININASGIHSDVIQADVDLYIKCKKRIPLLLRFAKSLNKREKFEIFAFFAFIFGSSLFFFWLFH